MPSPAEFALESNLNRIERKLNDALTEVEALLESNLNRIESPLQCLVITLQPG